MDHDEQHRGLAADQKHVFRNYLLLLAASLPILILAFVLVAGGYWPAALVIGTVLAVGIRPLRTRLGID